MNKDDEINQHLDDIMSALKYQDNILFAIGVMVIGIGVMVIGIAGMLLYVIRMVL